VLQGFKNFVLRPVSGDPALVKDDQPVNRWE
jgi:hypothetical protein